jgi:hypothetical protein
MAKLNIYVPDELKQRMDAVGDINWSDVARPSFYAALATHEQRRNPSMENAIERLRASKEETIKQDELQGKRDGRHWAENSASYEELRRVAKIDLDDISDDMVHVLRNAVDPRHEMMDDEFRNIFGDPAHIEMSDEYVEAFIEGAQEFWDEVEHKL